MPYTALIVDDEPLGREGLRLLLAEDPVFAETHEAKNGREAVRQIRALRPDLVFLDVQMPEMDGFEATAAIRARERFTADRLPILALTAHAMPGDQARCLTAGMDGYVTKPVRKADLLNAIQSATAVHSI